MKKGSLTCIQTVSMCLYGRSISCTHAVTELWLAAVSHRSLASGKAPALFDKGENPNSNSMCMEFCRYKSYTSYAITPWYYTSLESRLLFSALSLVGVRRIYFFCVCVQCGY